MKILNIFKKLIKPEIEKPSLEDGLELVSSSKVLTTKDVEKLVEILEGMQYSNLEPLKNTDSEIRTLSNLEKDKLMYLIFSQGPGKAFFTTLVNNKRYHDSVISKHKNAERRLKKKIAELKETIDEKDRTINGIRGSLNVLTSENSKMLRKLKRIKNSK